MKDARRDLPSVNALLETDRVRELLGSHPRSVILEAVRRSIEGARNAGGGQYSVDEWIDQVESALSKSERPSLRRVINATGVVLHTNLGRAPLAAAALDAIHATAEGYSNLEYDLDTGSRGSRYSHCVELLRQLTGAEDALVVNNCAAALVLTLNALAQKKEVLVSRGELVEIGGSFRIPDIMGRSGARLVEVGTTNRTHDDDYRRAISAKTGAIAKVHRSNFAIEGFTTEVSVERLAFIAAEHGLPVIHDLGSGLLISLVEFGLTGEPTAREALKAGATIVLMSGDKLLGGPQAGIILGSSDAVTKLRRNPFARAMRVDKLTLSALEATLRLYLDPSIALREIPVLAMLSAKPETLQRRALSMAKALGTQRIQTTVEASIASVGGGAFPRAQIPSFALRVDGNAQQTEQRLRNNTLPVIGRVSDDKLLLDVRSVMPAEDDLLTEAVVRALG
ncbi:MAG TPA: L-seryl-tRNA(Sec) selenium transferase [Gemmatimonadaceae bacterium]|nr:L-seryl-tRNA(Sec) selenium transferase [Gemmatimonadaceae bacterium]